MAGNKMDRGLDEIIAETRPSGPSRNRRGGGNRRREYDQPRDGVRKSYRSEPRNLEGEWVHDRFEENNFRRAPAPRRRRDSLEPEVSGTKLRVDNIHYDLTEDDLDELFRRIGPITKLQLRYDRAGRSEGTAFVTYEIKEDAREAVKQFDGANANGQPIRLQLLSGRAGYSSRNPFDSAVMPGRPLAERITEPGARARSHSPQSRYTQEEAARKGIDRYIPGQNARSRSPVPHRRGGRRPGVRREGGGRDQEASRGGRGNPRGKKTQEELDAEMADYFGGESTSAATNGDSAPSNNNNNNENGQPTEDIDMIE